MIPAEGTAYRSESLQCPTCPDLLRAIPLGGVIVDVCDGCGGVWFDWFDGDVPSLAVEISQQARAPSGAPAEGCLACPRCGVALHDESFQGQGPGVLRCPSCQGIFVPHGALAPLAALASLPEDAPRDTSFWSRLWLALRGLLAGRG